MTLIGLMRIAERLGFRRRTAAILLAFYLGSTFFEALGLTMLMPVFQFINSGGDLVALAAENRAWEYLIALYDRFGLSVTLPALLIVSFICILARTAFTYARLVYTARAREDLLRHVRRIAFDRYLAVDSNYAERALTGSMVNDLTIELNRAVFAAFSAVTLGGLCLMILIYVGVLAAASATMTVAAICVFALAGTGLRTLWRKTESVSYAVTDANQRMADFLVERLKALRLIRLSATEPGEAAAMARLTQRQRDTMCRLATLMARLDVMIEPLVAALGLLMLYLSVGVFGLGLDEVGLFLVIVLRLIPVVKETLRTRQSMIGSYGAVDAVNNRLNAMETAREPAGGTARFDQLQAGIRFEHVGFHYPDANRPALNDVTLTIKAGQVTALVGPSGAGKSTLIDLLPRLRQPDSGAVYFDDRKIDDFSLESLRAGIAYAPQSPQILSASIGEHIGYGRIGATDEQINRAARRADADGFIQAAPDGYDTALGEGGVGLSGGQRQRLDLARALVREAPILILDEPTSNLDADAEALVRETIQRLRRETDMTVIVVGHRLSTVRIADLIVVMRDGRIEDQGSHAELVGRGGWYAEAMVKQGTDVEPLAATASG